jgi:acyl-CoA synthetase (AMP-forming)/AMP-acid ligase II/3-oxoacyl-(acyl-carrier-protein) synthase
MFVQHMEHDDDTPRRCRRRRLAVTIGHRDGVREVHVVADDAPGRDETGDARFVAAARTDAKRRDRAAVAAVREARRRVERTAEKLGVSTRDVLEAVVPDGAVACRAAAPMVVVDDLGLAGISSIVSPRAHENAVETMLALCPEMRACDGLGGMRSKSAQSETKTSVLVDGEGRFGIAVTTRIVREEDDASQCRRSSATWRRWGAPRGRWPKARTNRSSMGTLTRRILPSASLTVCQRFSIQVSPTAAERHAPWPCVETGCVADGLLRVALARKDGREDIPSAAVDIRDLKLLSENARTFSYAELFEASVRVAHFITDVLHAKPGDVVAIMSRNSYEVFVLHHACALVRCVLLNLNTHLVSRELTYILRDSECRFVFARRREHLDVLNEVVPLMETNAVDSIIWMVDDDEGSSESGVTYPSRVKNFDWNSDALAFRRDERDVLTVLNEELSQIKDAHLYYTSGTTGNPKGVCLKHEVVSTHARATLIEMRLNSQDVWLHAAPMFHLVDAFAIYSITEVCGRHVFLPAFETTRLLRVIASERVTVTNLASSMVAIMTHHPLCGAIDLSSLRLASCGGSPLPPTTVRRAIALLGCEFFVSYGMTECCGKISMSILSDEFRKCHSAEEQVDAICTSGRPFCLMSIKVVQPDDGRTVVASDGRTVGEVFIKGPTLFSGYLKNPEATRRSFDEQGYFATGDLAVVQPNGFISVVDRKKDMILSGGENVYCVEVERVIHAHRAVKQASVLGIPNSIMGEVVHAVVTLKNPSDDETPSDITADLMRHCESQLSQFKCPSAIHIVDALPLNASGKVLKRRLREMIANGEAITANESRGASRVEPIDGRVDAPPPKTSPTKVGLEQISLNAKDDHHKAREVFIVGTSHFDETLRLDAVSVVPITRWDICDVNDRIRVKSGGFLCVFGVFLDEATVFDSQMFGLSDMEAVVADPQQRLILKSVSTLPVRPNPCASVHIGVSQVEFPRIFVNVREELSPYYATSAHLSVVAGRVCFTFALSGHAESIDTACSSSLVATHRGYETHSQSIVGGVNLTIDVTWSLACHTANMLSADGRCKTLDASADGYVRAEHCAVLLLSCDHACPTRIVKLCGVAVNQDGRSSSLTAPNGPSQTKVITAAYDGATMESVAMHGTGTPLGDPIEVGALQAAMHDTDLSPVQMYAPKSLVGHSEPASGVTGIALNIKSVASSEIAPLVHLRCVNPHLEAIEKTRDIIMPRELMAMGDKTSASASAFAFQGTNAHGLIHRDSSKFFGTAIVKRRRHTRESMLWCARHAHGWIKTGCVLYGRIILTASIVHGLPCASLRDHVIHGQSIAPGTALLEIFVESFVNSSNSDVHGSAIVIPHAFKLEGGKKDGSSSTIVANVIVRRHDGRIAVTSGPLCQPRTHLYGQACKVCTREMFSSVRSRLWMKREMPGQIFASIANTTHGSSQRHSTNLNAYTLDAAIHLAESVLQYHTTLQARIPAGLASVSAGKHKRGDDSVQRIVKTNCAFGDDDGYLKRALHDHFTNHVLLHALDIRSPLRDRGKTPIRRASRSLVYASSHHAELSPREKIITRGPVSRSAREDDSTRCLASMITPSVVDDSVLALQKHSEVSSALVGALRSAVHEKSTSSSSVVRCFQYNETAPSRGKDGDPWTVPRVDGGSTHVRMLSPAHLRQGEKNDFNPRHKERCDESSDMLTVYGGTGALGMYSAKNLGSAENSRRIRVTGRSGRTSQRLQVVDSCQIASLRCDGGTKSEAINLVSAAVFGRLLFTSGILADASWKKLSFRLVTTVCAPKLNCKRDQLDYARAIACRVFFSSATACVGNSGQTVYGAANAVLDHRAASACSMGVNALSLQWGAFSGGGMASGVESHLSRIGIGVLTPDVCVKVLQWCIANLSKKLVSSSLCVSNFDWETFSTFHVKARESKFFSAVIDGRGQTPVIKGKTQIKAVTTTSMRVRLLNRRCNRYLVKFLRVIALFLTLVWTPCRVWSL